MLDHNSPWEQTFIAVPFHAPFYNRLGKDCSPHIAPVWFLCVCNIFDTTDGESMDKGVIFRGRVELVETDTLEIVFSSKMMG
jgi:hypothetical protein